MGRCRRGMNVFTQPFAVLYKPVGGAMPTNRSIGDLSDPVLLAEFEQFRAVRAVEDEAERILNRYDLHDLHSRLQLLQREVRDADVADLSLTLQIGQGAKA